MIGNAIFSPCGKYRYALSRVWGDDPTDYFNFVGLNPSTATAEEDDPTIRRCIGFAKVWGASAMVMTNIFAYRATDPKKMIWLSGPEGPIGHDNDFYLKDAALHAKLVVAAWGNDGAHLGRWYEALCTLNEVKPVVHCLGHTKTGQPKHPLYLAKSTALEVYYVP